MAMMLLSLISLLLLLGTIIFLILKKFKIFTSLSLFYVAAFCANLKFRKFYPMPGPAPQVTDVIYFPIIIATIILCLGILCLFINKLAARSPNRPVRFRWLWFAGGAVILMFGNLFAMAALHLPFNAPKILGPEPLPGWSCLILLLVYTVVSLIFYRVSQMNSEAYPNFMRYLVFLVALHSIIGTEFFSLVMLGKPMYGPRIFYPFWGAIITLAFLPPSLLILGIAKDHLPLQLNHEG
jgi:hypothetical protein